MIEWQYIYLIIFSGGLALSLLFTPLFQAIAIKSDFMDRPKNEAHKKHGKVTPLLGGAAMFCSWAVCLAGGFWLLRSGNLPQLAAPFRQYASGASLVGSKLLFLIGGAFMAMLLGLLDDKWALKAGTKFFGQFIIALVAVLLGGAHISFFCPLPWVNIAVSVFWFMLLMNSINFFDNMDGLAVGTIAIAMVFFAVVSALSGQYFVASLAALTCGTCCGFWFYNSDPASIFMGDSGSHFLGYTAAAVSTLVTYFRLDQSLSRFPVLVPLFILAVPLFDTLMVVIIRWRHGKPFWIGDHNHISHRFVKMGLSRKRAVQLVHLMALAIGLSVLPILWGTFQTAAVLVAQTFLVLVIISIMQFSLADDHRS